MNIAKMIWWFGNGNQTPQIDPDDYIFVIFDIGQSNSIGRAEADRVDKLTKYTIQPYNSFAFYKPDYTATDNGVMSELLLGSTRTKEPDGASSAVKTFGAYGILTDLLGPLSENRSYVIPVGRGGTSLEEDLFDPNFDWYEGSAAEMYVIATARYYSIAYDDIAALHPDKTIFPIICWHQGEADAQDATATSNYPTNFSGSGRFLESLRASHSSLENAPLYITKIHYNESANEGTINDYFDTLESDLIKIIDISDQPKKSELTTDQKGGVTATSSGGDDIHTSYLGQVAKAERIYSLLKTTYFNAFDDSEITEYDNFDPSTITADGVRLQGSRDNVTFDTYYGLTAATNNLNIGTFNAFTGSLKVPMFKVLARKGYIYFPGGLGQYHLENNIATISSSSAIGTSLFAGSFSVAFFFKPSDGIPTGALRPTIFYDIQNTAAVNNSRVACRLEGVNNGNGKLRVFIAVGGTLVQALTNTAVFEDGSQPKEKHIAITFTNGNLIRIYVNGVLRTLDATLNGNISGIDLANYVNNTNPFTIGATLNTVGPNTYILPCNGYIRDFIIQPGVVYDTDDIANLMLN